jgi:hypothetical protein
MPGIGARRHTANQDIARHCRTRLPATNLDATKTNQRETDMAKTEGGAGQPPLQARVEGGGTPRMTDWVMKSETGLLKDVLLGPAESFRWMGEENAAYSSLVRDTLRRGYKFDKQVAARQHREMVDAYEDAGVNCHYLPLDMHNPYQVSARDSSFMTPYGAVICQLANPRRRGEYASALRFYLANNIPVYDMVSAGNFEGGENAPGNHSKRNTRLKTRSLFHWHSKFTFDTGI